MGLFDGLFKPDVEKLEKNNDLQGLITALDYQKDTKVREDAIIALCKIGDSNAIEPLIAVLKNSDWHFRESVAKSLDTLTWTHEYGEVSAYFLIVKGDFNKCIAIGYPAVSPLLEAIKDSDFGVRENAAEALGKIGDPRAVETLIAAALMDVYDGVRKNAVEALGRIGDAQAVEPLITAATRDSEYYKPGPNREFKPFVPSHYERWSTDRDVQRSAAEALGKISDKQAVEPLIAALSCSDYAVRQSAAFALGNIGDRRAVEPLIAALNNGDQYVRASTATALGMIGDSRAVEALLDFLQFEEAAKSLGKIGDNRAVEPLIAALKHDSFNVRKNAAIALDGLKWNPRNDDEVSAYYWIAKNDYEKCVSIGAPAVKPLVSAVLEGDDTVRKSAIEALGKMGSHYEEPLIVALKDPFFRSRAAEALDVLKWAPRNDEVSAYYWIAKKDYEKCVNIGAPAIEPLFAEGSFPAALALRQLGDPRGIEWWLKDSIHYLKHVSFDERKYAAEQLGKIGDARAVEPLIEALNEVDPEVRQSAVEALGKIGDARAVEPLTGKLQDPNGTVRKSAADALGKIRNRLGHNLTNAIK